MKKKKKEIEPITHEEWVKEMFIVYDPIPEGGVTIEEISKLTNTQERTTRYRVCEKVRRGELKVHNCLSGGRPTKYYTKITK